jgi:hypothetical protein
MSPDFEELVCNDTMCTFVENKSGKERQTIALLAYM